MRRWFGSSIYRFLVVFSVVSLVGSVYAGDPATAYAQSPDPQDIYLESLAYGGTGCPAGSVASSFANDRKSFTLIFGEFLAFDRPSGSATDRRKNCQLSIRIHVPEGFTYAVHTFDYRGFVQLPDGGTAEQKATYSFGDDEEQSSRGSRFQGPVAKDYLARDTLAQLAWSPCGETVPLNVNAQARVNVPPGQAGQITVDSIDGKVTTILRLTVRPC